MAYEFLYSNYFDSYQNLNFYLFNLQISDEKAFEIYYDPYYGLNNLENY